MGGWEDGRMGGVNHCTVIHTCHLAKFP
jgi:hypothetical protein